MQLHCPNAASPGEDAVVYEIGDEFSPDTYVAVFREDRRVRVMETPEDFRAVACVWSSLDEKSPYLLIALRNIGDGAATRYLAYGASVEGTYRRILSEFMTQAQVRIGPEPGKMEFWDARDDGTCVWCPHRYSVSTYSWSGTKFVMEERHNDPKWRSPETLAQEPIVKF